MVAGNAALSGRVTKKPVVLREPSSLLARRVLQNWVKLLVCTVGAVYDRA